MLIRRCMVGAVLFVALVTASFALVADDASFGIAEAAAPSATQPPVDTRIPLHEPGPHCPYVTDCNHNHVDDPCDLDCQNDGIFCIDFIPVSALCDSPYFASCGTSDDCNENEIPDECEDSDCNGNGVLDECEGVVCCDDDGDCPHHQCCGHSTRGICGWCRY